MIADYISLQGLRKSNEDKHNVLLKKDNISNINYFGVYDGHGGNKVSTFLSKNLPSYFVDKRIKYPLSKNYVNKVFNHIQEVLRNEHKDYSYNSGSTCTVAINFKKNDDEYLNVLNLGDSRCVLCRDNLAISLTKDHKPHWPEENIRINKIGGNIYFDGDDWRINDLSVSRAFGDIDAQPYVTHTPELFRYKIAKNDKFIILACDGLWDVVSNQEAVNFVISTCYNTNFKLKNKTVARKLAEYAIRKGSTDNVSIIVSFFK